MSDNEIVYRLYLDGLDAKQTLVITKQLEMVNRIGKTTNSLTGAWVVENDRSRADAMYLTEGRAIEDLESIGIPILTDADIPRGYLHKNIVAISHPHTAVLLANWLEQAEELMRRAGKIKDDRPDNPAATATSAGAGSERARTGIHAGTAAGTAGAAGAPGGDKRLPENKSAGAGGRNDARQIPFTHIIRDAKNDLLLSWGESKVWYSASKRKFFTNLGDAVNVVERVFKKEPLITITDKTLDETLPFITYDSLMWSYGLRAEPSKVFVKNASIEKNKFKLSKWPLFGQWETQSKLLLISALFTQKFSSVPEVVHKTECSADQIVRFLYAAYLSNIPIDREALTARDYETIRDLKPEDENKIKSIAWIDQLRAKLRMQDFL